MKIGQNKSLHYCVQVMLSLGSIVIILETNYIVLS